MIFSAREEDTTRYNTMNENGKRALKYIEKDNLGYVLESISEVAEFYEKSFKTIESWIRRGLPRDKIGTKQYVYPIRDINDWLLEKNVLNLSGNEAVLLRCQIAELQAALFRKFLYLELPAAIKKAGVEELPRVIREWTLYYESEAIKSFEETA